LASAADEVWISQTTDMMGSVGVYVTFADIKGYYEAQGLKIHEIYADQSSEKNKDFKEALKGNYTAIKENMLNPIAAEFQAAMLDYRAGKIAAEGDHLKGKTYMGEQCIEVGFADAMGNFEQAIAHLSERITQSNQNQFFNSNNTNMKFKSAWGAILTAISFGAVTSEDEAPLVTEERLEQLNSSLEAANCTIDERDAAIAQLQAELNTATEERDAATATVATLTEEQAALNTQIAELSKGPGDTHTETKKEKVEGKEQDTVSEEEAFKSYAHNQKALEEIKNM
jgi:ClpP class serine protease